ncbi:MAG: 1-deoxy-D-xylulose-5-phosphate synthase, partial [Candidatus Azotimanducaceae bacterium]
TFAIDRAGLLEDGPTHSGIFDLSFLRCVPNIIVMAPSDENETRQMLYTGYSFPGPAAIRYPRGKGPGTVIEDDMTALEIGKARQLRKGRSVAILAFGSMVTPARSVASQIDASLVDMRFVKPLDEALISEMAMNHDLIVTIEENCVLAGAGSGVSEYLHNQGLVVDTLHLGIPDRFISQDKPSNMLAECGLDVEGILLAIKARTAGIEKNSSLGS